MTELRAPDTQPIFTIGHSTRSMPEFAALLGVGRIDCVVDVRSIPRSRRNPTYNFDALPEALASHRIGYRRIAALGGRRPKSKAIPPEVNGFWVNQSFHNYADHALSEDFRRGLAELVAIAARHRVAIMCAEAVWWRCHRRIVADYLLQAGGSVLHLMDPMRATPARMTPAAQAGRGGLVYPAGRSA